MSFDVDVVFLVVKGSFRNFSNTRTFEHERTVTPDRHRYVCVSRGCSTLIFKSFMFLKF